MNAHPRAVERTIYQRVVRIPRNRSQQGIMDMELYEAEFSGMYGWKDISLDTEPDGLVYKPDSMDMEALLSL